MGCHDSRESAIAQMKAIYANEGIDYIDDEDEDSIMEKAPVGMRALMVKNNLLYEVGKRNSRVDAKNLRSILKATLTSLNPDDLDQDTIQLLKDSIPAPVPVTVSASVREELLREDMNASDLFETYDSPLEEAVIEETPDAYIIRNVVILSENSKNKRTYPESVRVAAHPLFEGAKAYLNHPAKNAQNDPRLTQDLIGRHRNIHTTGKLTYSDMHLVKDQLVKEVVLPRARAKLIGNSIAAKGKVNLEGMVEQITSVRSIDLVAEPATTNNLFEHDERKPLNKRPITRGERNMEKMTVEEILADKELREALGEHYKSVFEVETRWTKMEESIAAEKKRADDAEAKLLEHQVAEAEKDKMAAIDKLITESKIPETAKDDKLKKNLYGKSVEDAQAFLESLESIVKSVAPAGNTKPIIPNKEKVVGTASKDGPITEADISEAFTALSR